VGRKTDSQETVNIAASVCDYDGACDISTRSDVVQVVLCASVCAGLGTEGKMVVYVR
jgi:hypothetical protein